MMKINNMKSCLVLVMTNVIIDQKDNKYYKYITDPVSAFYMDKSYYISDSDVCTSTPPDTKENVKQVKNNKQ